MLLSPEMFCDCCKGIYSGDYGNVPTPIEHKDYKLVCKTCFSMLVRR